ncbi:hypothetical protein ACXY6Z_17255 [Sphingomonas aquatilis]
MAMNIDDIRAASRRELAEQRAEADNVSETTPSDATAIVTSFATSLGGEEPRYVPVIDDAHGLYGWCSDGVAQKVLADGGNPVFGWTIWEWPEALLTAEFHCVWKSPEGDLFDITPKPKREERILFVPDTSYPDDFDFDKRPRNRRVRTYQGKDRSTEASRLLDGLSGAKRAYEERRAAKAGLTLHDWTIRKVPTDQMENAIDDLIDACNQFEEHFDSLGASGLVQADDKFIALARRRMAAQARFKAMLH